MPKRKQWEVTALVTFSVNGCETEEDARGAVHDLEEMIVTSELELRKTITVLATEVQRVEESN